MVKINCPTHGMTPTVDTVKVNKKGEEVFGWKCKKCVKEEKQKKKEK